MKTESLSTLKIHTLSQQQFDREKDAGTLNANEFYFTPAPGVDKTPTENSENLITSGGVYTAIQNKITSIPTKTSQLENDSGFMASGGNIVLFDRTTNDKYVLFVDNGELKVEKEEG